MRKRFGTGERYDEGDDDMVRAGLIAATLLACLGLSACGTVRTCIDHPIACAGVAAGVAGGVYLAKNGAFAPAPSP